MSSRQFTPHRQPIAQARAYRALLRRVLPALCCALLLLAAACAPRRVPAPSVQPPKPEALAPSWRMLPQGRAEELARSINLAGQELASARDLAEPLAHSLRYVRTKPLAAPAITSPGLALTWGQLETTLTHLLEVLPALDADPGLLAREFVWYELMPAPLATGYYSPEVQASLTRNPAYPYPIYGLPPDLKKLDLGAFHPRWQGQQLVYRMEGGKPVPYHDRKAIDQDRALAGKGLEIAWAKDPWDIYHLQVQGSGFLKLPDGRLQPILYAGKNGREFVSAEKALLEQGSINKGSLNREGIRGALSAMGEDGRSDHLCLNPSYVFFSLAATPPAGAIQAPVTGLVSLAVDPQVIPLGSVVNFAMSVDNATGQGYARPFDGIGLAQDTGGVIKGLRVDFYCGAGLDKETLAFHIKTPMAVRLFVSRRAFSETN